MQLLIPRPWCTGEGEFEQFSEFLAGKSCSKLKSKQGGFFRLALAVRTKKFRWKNSYRVKSYSTFTAHVWDICSMAGPGRSGRSTEIQHCWQRARGDVLWLPYILTNQTRTYGSHKTSPRARCQQCAIPVLLPDRPSSRCPRRGQ